LWARFDKAGLDRMMRAANLPVWGANRPRVLVWLADERGGQRQLLSLEGDLELRDALRAKANSRGMPMQLPLMDLLDQSVLSAADLWAGYEAAIREASERYPHDVILSGRVRDLGGRWEAQWTLWDRVGTDDFSARTGERTEAVLSGIDAAQDLLASRYAPASSGEGSGYIRARFIGVDSLPSYGRLMQILRAQESITRINVRGSREDSLYLDLWVRGGENALLRILSLGGELRQVPPEELPQQQVIKPVAVTGQAPGAAVEKPVATEFLPADVTFNFFHR
jgi:hypothetical protein